MPLSSLLSRRAALAALSLLALAFSAPTAQAQTPALDFTGGILNGTSANTTRGYAFNVTGTGFTVTYLSFYDDDTNGLSLTESHSVGLWDPSGTLLTSVVIPVGTLAPLDSTGKFRFVNVTPVFLSAGDGYTVGATFLDDSGDNQVFRFGSLVTAPNITYVESRLINNTAPGVLVRPTNTLDLTGIPGGSFGGVAASGAAAAPEPGTIALLLTAGVPLAGLVRRRAKRRA